MVYNYGPATASFNVPQHMIATLVAYTGGIFDVTAADKAAMKPTDCWLTITVVIVGYTPDYWIAKNSWGASWGEGGFFKIKRNSPLLVLGGIFIPYLNITTLPTTTPVPPPTTPTTASPTLGAPVQGACAAGWFFHADTNGCYRFVSGKARTQAEVEQWCVNQGKQGSLVSIQNALEQNFVKSLVPTGTDNVLIGWNNQAWTDGTPNGFTKFSTGSATDKCAVMAQPSFDWKGVDCAGPFQNFVCKRNL